MSDCGVCGDLIHCSGGCGYVCTSDCSDCFGWCEPGMLPAFEFGVRLSLDNVLRSTRTGDYGTTVRRVGRDAEFPAPDVPRYAASTDFSFDLKGVSRRSLSQVLDALLTVNVRAARSNGDELVTMTWRGSASDLIRQVALVTD